MHDIREQILIVGLNELELKQQLRLRSLSRWQATSFTDVFLLRHLRHYTHFAVLRNPQTGEIQAGVGLRKEYVHLPQEGRIALLQLGKPFGKWQASNLSALRNRLLQWCVKTKLEHFTMPLYCWTDARNENEYLCIARFLPNLYPSRKNVTTQTVMQLIRKIGNRHFRDAFDPLTGAVQQWFYSGKVNYFPSGVSFEDKVHQNGHRQDLDFFYERNPGYARGDAMIVIAPLTLGNTAACFLTPVRFSISRAETRESAGKRAVFR